MREPDRLQIAADESRLSDVRDFVTRAAARRGLSPRGVANVRLAVDEACTNVIKHAYAERAGALTVEVDERRGWLEIRIRDQGESFDGRVDSPDLGRYVETRRKGGLGVFLMHRLMDEVRYATTPAGNEWLLRKRLPRRRAPEFASSLRFRYGLRTALVLLAVTMLAAVPLWVREGSERRSADLQSLSARAFGLAESARPVLLERTELSPEQTRLFEAVNALMKQEPRLLSVNVVAADGIIWAADRTAAAFTRFNEPGLGGPDARGVRQAVQEIESQPVLHLSVPVRVQNARGTARQLGAVYLSLRWADTEAAVRAARLRLLGVALLLYAVGTALLALLLSAFLRPVQRLIDGVRNLGSAGGTLAVDGPGEIGAIASAFNDMQARFQAAQESMAESERLQEEMQVAREIQSSILPQQVPDIAGYDLAKLYRPAGEIGGDYYDFLAVNDDMTGIVVADVAGKGVPGSLVMAMIRTALRMEARDNTNAGDVLSRMNAFITADMRKGMFVTMYYVILDSRNRVISYASAGHNPMVLYRAETDETFFLNPKGMPVGLSLPDETLFGRNLDVERLRLRQGDMLVLYTDGITEATNAAREQYGEERLLQMVRRCGRGSPEEFVRALEADLEAFTAGAPPGDDITLVAIKEKLGAPTAPGGLRQRLADLIEREGVPVADACRRLKVSPSTYYRFKSRGETPADDLEPQRLSLEKREHLLRLVGAHPEFGARELAEHLHQPVWGGLVVPALVVHEELRLLQLDAPELRRSYAHEARRRTGRVGAGSASGAKPEMMAAPGAFALSPAAGAGVSATRAAATADGDASTAEPAGTDLCMQESGLRGRVEFLAENCGCLDLAGFVDSGSCAALENVLQRAGRTAALLAVDLARVAYVSSRGWGLFAADAGRRRQQGGELVLCGMRPEVRDVYRMLGFEPVVRAFADRAAAAAALIAGPAAAASVLSQAAAGTAALATATAGAVTLGGTRGSASGRPESSPGAPVAAPAFILEGVDDLDGEWESLSVRAGSVGPAGEVTLVALEGILDTVSAYRLQRVLGDLVGKGARRILVDLSRTEFVSSAGWGTFTAHLRELRAAGGDLKLFGMNRDVARIHELLGLGAVVASFDLLTQALEAFGLTLEADPEIGAAGVSSPSDLAPETPPAPVELASAELRTSVEPLGTSGRGRRIVLGGRWRGTQSGDLDAWLQDACAAGEFVVVDARGFLEADEEAWGALQSCALAVVARGARLHVLAPEDGRCPGPTFDLPLHSTLAEALGADQRRGVGVLRAASLPASELAKDAELRRAGWWTYLARLRQAREGEGA